MVLLNPAPFGGVGGKSRCMRPKVWGIGVGEEEGQAEVKDFLNPK